MKIEDVARICHEANRAYCLSLNDLSQPLWNDAPLWQKDSAINGVKYHLRTPNSSPADSHENWLKEKRDAGWKYGKIKDPSKKEHPCFLPYDQLPIEQRMKDSLFISIVNVFRDEV